MQRKKSKKTRLANSIEKEHMAWIKQRGRCAACGARGPVINHHIWGATWKVKVDLVTVLIGHAAVLGLCEEDDKMVTLNKRAFEEKYGKQNKLWYAQYTHSPVTFPDEVVKGIWLCNR